LDERSTEKKSLPSFLRQWSAMLPQLEADLADPAHPLRRALVHLLPPHRSTSGTLDAQQAAALAGLCLFVEDSRWTSSHFTAEKSHGGLAALRSKTNVSAVLAQVAEERQTADPAAHLLEMLLAQSPADTRRQRGVYFTPQPLVRFLVQSVDAVLRRDFDIAEGLADSSHALRIVDPACGTGVFLMEIQRQWPQRNTDQLVGIDVMPACCAAVQLILAEHSPTVICANALQDVELSESLLLADDGLPIIVGNPPYSNFGRKNQGDWIRRQLAEYKSGLEERKLNLDDDFIKFMRWGQYWIDRAGRGVMAMVTNNTYLNGLTHRRMRASLLSSFDRRYLVDLQGDRRKMRVKSATKRDENVFDIQQGVAVCLLAKTGRDQPTRTTFASLTGARSRKLDLLKQSDALSLPHVEFEPAPPQFFFRRINSATEGELYASWPALNEIFMKYTSGVQTKRDALFVGFTTAEVADQVRAFLADARRGQFSSEVPPWLRKKTPSVAFDIARIRPYMVAPFDMRWIYYDSRLLGRARFEVMRHLQPGNCGLVFMRQSTNDGGYDHFLATSALVSDRVFYSAHGAPFFAPLMLHTTGDSSPNFSRTWVDELQDRLGVRVGSEITAADVFHWIYAVVHNPTYRQQFEAMLRVGFPRIRWPVDTCQFQHAAALGKELAELHLSVSGTALPEELAVIDEHGTGEPTGADWASSLKASLPEEVWQFRIGGYAVLPRWLRQRRQRIHVPIDTDYLQRLIAVVQQTLAITDRINAVISPL
jgi:predicted helicase